MILWLMMMWGGLIILDKFDLLLALVCGVSSFCGIVLYDGFKFVYGYLRDLIGGWVG